MLLHEIEGNEETITFGEYEHITYILDKDVIGKQTCIIFTNIYLDMDRYESILFSDHLRISLLRPNIG
jgi:hypothetical protein